MILILVGFGFGWIWFGFDSIWLDFGWIRLDFGWIRLDFGLIRALLTLKEVLGGPGDFLGSLICMHDFVTFCNFHVRLPRKPFITS